MATKLAQPSGSPEDFMIFSVLLSRPYLYSLNTEIN
jgi:hypothetical protein